MRTNSNDGEISVKNEKAVTEQPNNEVICETEGTHEEVTANESIVEIGPFRPKRG